MARRAAAAAAARGGAGNRAAAARRRRARLFAHHRRRLGLERGDDLVRCRRAAARRCGRDVWRPAIDTDDWCAPGDRSRSVTGVRPVGCAVDGDVGARRIGGDGQRRLGLDLEQLRRTSAAADALTLPPASSRLWTVSLTNFSTMAVFTSSSLSADGHRRLRRALLDGAVEQLVGAERLARLRHAGRRLAVAAEDHLDLDEVLALHHAHAAGRRRRAGAAHR